MSIPEAPPNEGFVLGITLDLSGESRVSQYRQHPSRWVLATMLLIWIDEQISVVLEALSIAWWTAKSYLLPHHHHDGRSCTVEGQPATRASSSASPADSSVEARHVSAR